MDIPTPNQNSQPSQLTLAEQSELEQFANEICDTEFEQLWEQVKNDSQGLKTKDLAEEFFYQGILAMLAIQKMEEKELEEQDARRFQYE